MGTKSIWDGKPTTDWHPVQDSRITRSRFMPQRQSMNTGHMSH